MFPVTPLRRGNLGRGNGGRPAWSYPLVSGKFAPFLIERIFKWLSFSIVIHVSFRGVNHEAMKNHLNSNCRCSNLHFAPFTRKDLGQDASTTCRMKLKTREFHRWLQPVGNTGASCNSLLLPFLFAMTAQYTLRKANISNGGPEFPFLLRRPIIRGDFSSGEGRKLSNPRSDTFNVISECFAYLYIPI